MQHRPSGKQVAAAVASAQRLASHRTMAQQLSEDAALWKKAVADAGVTLDGPERRQLCAACCAP